MKRKVVVFIIVVVLIMGFGITYIFRNSVGTTANLQIEVAPSKSTLTINGNNSKGGSIKVKPGKYDISVSKKGFVTQSQAINIIASESKFVGFVLVPNTPETKDWYQFNQSDNYKAQGISSTLATSSSSDALKQLPFIQELPYIGPGYYYRVDYGYLDSNAQGSPVVFISSASNVTHQARQAALTWIREKGYDVSDFKVVFRTMEPQ